MPQNTIRAYFGLTSGVTGSVTLYGTLPAISLSPVSTGGLIMEPIPIPPNADLTRPLSIYFWIQSNAASTVDGQVVSFQLAPDWLSPGLTTNPASILYDWPVPNAWQISETQRILFDDGTSLTFPGNTFTGPTMLGLNLIRNGPGVNDTYLNTVNVLRTFELTYYLRCQQPCCC